MSGETNNVYYSFKTYAKINNIFENMWSIFHQIRFKSIVNIKIQTLDKPITPSDISNIFISKQRSELLDSIFENYDKMWNTGT